MNRSIAIPVSLFILVCALGLALWSGVFAGGAEPGSEADPLVARSYVDQFVKFQVVVVPAGQRLEITTPGAEIVLRAGRALVIGSESGGLVNATVGKDMAGGEAIAANHLLIVPRADGRGIEAVTDATVMVRGGFSIR